MERRQFICWIIPVVLAPWTSGCGAGNADSASEGPPPAKSHVGRITDLIAKKGAKPEAKKAPKR